MDELFFVTTFSAPVDLLRACAALDAARTPYRRLDPPAALRRVALAALVMTSEARARLAEADAGIRSAGWAEFRPSQAPLPCGPCPGRGACFDAAAIQTLSPCVADDTKLRLVARIEGRLAPAMPYLNAAISNACYTPSSETLTYLDGHRMIALYDRRISIAKTDDIVDSWLTLERIRAQVEQVWRDRDTITPCFETRKRPPALEILRRLPGTNCGLCGEMTCMAFALRAWAGQVSIADCRPVFEDPAHQAAREALLEIAAALGVDTRPSACEEAQTTEGS